MKDFPKLSGAGGMGGSAPSAPSTKPDNLLSDDFVEFVLGLCEGPIGGLARGPSSFYFDDTPLVSNSGDNNFNPFELSIFHGETVATPVRLALGGTTSNTNVGVQLVHDVGVTRQTSQSLRGLIDQLEVRIVINALGKTNDNGDQLNHTTKFQLEYREVGTSNWQSTYDDGIITIRGKTSAGYARDFVIDVPRIQNDWEIRVIKLTQDNLSNRNDSVSWESFQMVTKEDKAYPNLAVVQGRGKASDQFQSIPTFYGVYATKVIKVPSNYDVVTRHYNGFWDGTFVEAVTDNPAWILYDLLTNDVYGFRKHYPELLVDRFSFYDAARWCDELIPRPVGGYQPRWTYNDVIAESRNASEMLFYIAGVFGGVLVPDRNGSVRLKVDRPGLPVQLFGPESVSVEGFSYQFTDLTQRVNDLTVRFVNPNLGWEQDARRVFDQELIDFYGSIPQDLVPVGCIDVYEAQRRGFKRIVQANTERTTVSFRTARAAVHIEVFDLIGITDPDMNWGISGRVKSISGSQIQLRDQVFVPVDTDLELSLALASGPVELTVRSSQAATTTLDIQSGGYPAGAPEFAQFALTHADLGLVKPFRVLKIEEDPQNPELLLITALEQNINKYGDIDNLVSSGTVDYSSRLSNQPPAPVISSITSGATNLVTRQDGTRLNQMVITWDHDPRYFTQTFQVNIYDVDLDQTRRYEVRGRQFNFEGGIQDHLYEIQVLAKSVGGKISLPSDKVSHTFLGHTVEIVAPAVTGVSTIRGVTLEIESPTISDFSHYLIESYDDQGSLVGTQISSTTNVYRTVEDGDTATYYKVATVDSSGNIGEFSTAVTIAPRPVDTTDLDVTVTDAITSAQTDASQAIADAVTVQANLEAEAASLLGMIDDINTGSGADAVAAAAARDAAELAETNADAARINAETAQSLAETARDNSLTYRDAAEAAKTDAEAAQALAVSAQTGSEAFRDASQAAAADAATQVTAAEGHATAAGGFATAASASETAAGQDAAAAQASRLAAETAESGATIAKDASVVSQTNAAGSASAASNSATLAANAQTEADNAASAALSSAQTAASEATDAGTQAGIATTQAGVATTKAGEASFSATQSANSATSASGSANSASSSAGLAATAQGNAETAAAAAATSATNAAASASGAVSSASASESSRLAAEAAEANAEIARAASVVAQSNALGSESAAQTAQNLAAAASFESLRNTLKMFPSDFEEEALYWTDEINGTQESRVLGGNPPDGVFVDSSEGKLFEIDPSTSSYRFIAPRGTITNAQGRRIKVKVVYRYVDGAADPTTNLFYTGFRTTDSAGQYVSADVKWAEATGRAQNTWHTIEHDIFFPDSWLNAIPCLIKANTQTWDGKLQLREFLVEDITESYTATIEAEAALSYKDAAAASATDAGTQAGVATTQAGIATTKAADATFEATKAANSATDADGSAISATASESSALRAAIKSKTGATGNLVFLETYENEGEDDWSNIVNTSTDVPGIAPADSESLVVIDGARQLPEYTGDTNGRTFRMSGWVKTSGITSTVSFAIRGKPVGGSDGQLLAGGASALTSATTAWTFYSVELTITEATENWSPAFDRGSATGTVLAWGLRCEDITLSEEAAASASIATAAVVDANNAAASAATSSQLASQFSAAGGGVLSDTTFNTWGDNTVGGWEGWSTNPVVTDSIVYPGGQDLRFNVATSTQAGARVVTTDANSIWTGPFGADYYRVEVAFTLHSGVLDGAGVYIQWVGSSAFAASLELTNPDVRIVGEDGGVQVATMIIQRPVAFDGLTATNMQVIVMANWSAFGNAAKDISFHRCFVRPVTLEEIGGGLVMTSIDAEITDYNSVLTSPTGAIATQINAMKTLIEDPEGLSVGAAIASEAETRASNENATATLINGLSAAVRQGTSVIEDPYFSAFPDTDGWAAWSMTSSNYTVMANEVYPALGSTVQIVCPAATSMGMVFASTASGWVGVENAEAFVMEVEYTLTAGAIDGSFVYVRWNGSTQGVKFEPLSDNTIGTIEFNKPMVAKVLLIRPAGVAGFTNITAHLMAGWTGGGTVQAKTIKFHRASIRTASKEEIEASEVRADVLASIADIENLNVTPTSAMGTLLTQLDVSAGGTSAKVTEFAAAKVDLDDFSAAYAGITVETESGGIAGFKATSFSNPDGTGASSLDLLGDVVRANTIAASKILVSDRENLFVDGTFENQDLDLLLLTGNHAITFNTGATRTGGAALSIGKTSSGSVNVASHLDYAVPVVDGEEYFCEVEARATTSNITAGFYFRIRFLDINKAYMGHVDVVSNTALSTTWSTFSKQVTVPASARYIQWQVYNHSTNATTLGVLVDRVYMRRANGAQLVVDGSITGNHVAANTMTTDKLVVGDLSNILPNPNLENNAEGWVMPGGASVVAAGTSWPSNRVVYMVGAGTSYVVPYSPAFAVTAGEVLHMSYAGSTDGTNPAHSVRADIQLAEDAAFTVGVAYITVSNSHIYADEGLQTREGTLTIPAGKKYARVRFIKMNNGATGGYIGGCVLRRAATAELVDTASFASAGLALFGGDIQSANFVTGTTGWAIDQTGSAEFNALIVRTSLEDGAVSDIQDFYQSTSNTTDPDTTHLTFEDMEQDGMTVWSFAIACEGKTNDFPSAAKITVQARLKVGGVWGSYVDVITKDVLFTSFTPVSLHGVFGGVGTEISFRIRNTAVSNGALVTRELTWKLQAVIK
jgi:predicted phage tail protein